MPDSTTTRSSAPGHEPGGIWEARYRDLERTLEHVMIQVAEAMEAVEQRLAAAEQAERRAARLSIRKLYQDPDEATPTIVCVADGENLSYRYTVLEHGQVVHESPELRHNSYPVPAGVRGDRARVTVVSHGGGQPVVDECRLVVAR